MYRCICIYIYTYAWHKHTHHVDTHTCMFIVVSQSLLGQ